MTKLTINGSAFAPVDPTPVPTDDVPIPAGRRVNPVAGWHPADAGGGGRTGGF
jgi:hypothetical protein